MANAMSCLLCQYLTYFTTLQDGAACAPWCERALVAVNSEHT